ncbi:MAG: hypothetical protein ACOC1S_01600 [bacterium]
MFILQVLKTTIKRFYDNSFYLVIINLIWSFTMGFLGTFGYGAYQVGLNFFLIIPFVLAGPLTLSGIELANQSYEEKEISIKPFFTGIRKYFKRGLKAFTFSFVVYLIFFLDFYYFPQLSIDSIIIYIMYAVILFLAVIFTIMQLYFWALLVVFPELSLIKLLKRSFVLTFDNLIFSILWLIIFVIIFGILIYFRATIPAFFITLPGVYIITGTRMLLEKY